MIFQLLKETELFLNKVDLVLILKNEHNTAEFLIPDPMFQGIVYLNFDNLDNNSLAKTTFPIVIDRVEIQNNEISIPQWVRNNAEWWAAEQIDDTTFIQSIEYLIKNDIIVIPATQQQESSEIRKFLHGFKNNAEWWAAEQIDR